MKKSTVRSRQFDGLSVAVFCALLAGCNVGPRYLPPAITAPAAFKESPTQFKESGGWTVAQPQDAALRGKWWEIYNEPELNALEDQLNIDNQNIRQAFENFMEARALVREARSQYFPTVGVGGSYTRSRSSSNVGSAASSGTTGGKQSQVFSIPGVVSWEPDLWDKVRNTVRASQYEAQLSAADLENERLTEQASLAVYFFEIRGQDALQKLLNDTVEADKKALEIAKTRYDTGVDDQISVVEAQTTLESAQSAAINIGIARAQYEHAIAMLVGKPAPSFSIPVEPATSAPRQYLLEFRPNCSNGARTSPRLSGIWLRPMRI
jgi:outer membrane protein TolC